VVAISAREPGLRLAGTSLSVCTIVSLKIRLKHSYLLSEGLARSLPLRRKAIRQIACHENTFADVDRRTITFFIGPVIRGMFLKTTIPVNCGSLPRPVGDEHLSLVNRGD
jgi:hypothetical protein